MAMIRCEAGEHFYDSSKNSSCPWCNSSNTLFNDGKTKIASQNETKEEKTSFRDREPVKNSNSQAPKTVGIWGNSSVDDKSKESIAPVVGWLVVIEGEGYGRDLRVVYGMNKIGRDSSNEIVIDFGDETISRENHAILIYDYQNNLFFFQHGGGQNLSYLNNQVVLQPAQLKSGDIIGVGKTKLKFIPLCDDSFKWDK